MCFHLSSTLSSHAFPYLLRPFSLLTIPHIPHYPFPTFISDHNKTHAADVLHATSYLLFEQIPEFTYAYSSQEEKVWRGNPRQHGSSGGNIASAFSVLELFACYMAAAMHDFDHPGRTNAFLVSTGSPLVSCRYCLLSCQIELIFLGMGLHGKKLVLCPYTL